MDINKKSCILTRNYNFSPNDKSLIQKVVSKPRLKRHKILTSAGSEMLVVSQHFALARPCGSELDQVRGLILGKALTVDDRHWKKNC